MNRILTVGAAVTLAITACAPERSDLLDDLEETVSPAGGQSLSVYIGNSETANLLESVQGEGTVDIALGGRPDGRPPPPHLPNWFTRAALFPVHACNGDREIFTVVQLRVL